MFIDTQMRDYDFEKIAEEANRFEQMGFDCVWTIEAAHDPFLRWHWLHRERHI